jgi:hypothetical protein
MCPIRRCGAHLLDVLTQALLGGVETLEHVGDLVERLVVEEKFVCMKGRRGLE